MFSFRSAWFASRIVTACCWRVALACGLVAFAASADAQETQLKPEEMAAQILNAGNKAYNEKQYPVAMDRYREYLKTFSSFFADTSQHPATGDGAIGRGE